ncbi:MAG: hypothetical protein A2622_09125 [Bdellovibrionales bacterium RIFCSPHIGHO2_01_FULL_40_29]|nr:MAG: hypothetical protein A2622_09125 [Bdellovibrionales bacterium RIFCSPHIGHO2_01_FULL_40_29]OFZ32893.1 MAG: hypothetical protein A3D17_09335 [Bdellovibrionales bacterium RIFCSPHIGHO2_02_FULL_40_15]
MSNSTEFSENILDTFRITSTGVFLKPYHAQRTFEAYQHLQKGISYSQIVMIYDAVESELLSKFSKDQIVRIVFKCDFSYSFQMSDFEPLPEPIALHIRSDVRQTSGVGKQNYKWESRPFWDELLKHTRNNTFDVISVNEKNHLVETSRFNIYAYDAKEDLIFTPPLSSGCINGVYRRHAFSSGYFDCSMGRKPLIERDLHLNEIKKFQLFVANSVRGVLSAALVSKT